MKMEIEREGKHIWKRVESHTAVLLISPEMLATSGFQQLLQTNKDIHCLDAFWFDVFGGGGAELY